MTTEVNTLYLGKEVIGSPVVNVQTGHQIGHVQDLYLDRDLRSVTGLYVGSEGLLNPTPKWIPARDVTVLGKDKVLVSDASIVTGPLDEARQPWLRRDDLQGRRVDTRDGKKLGRIGDVILSEEAAVIGFSLDRVYGEGAVAERRALRRTAVYEIGHEDDSITIDLLEAEQMQPPVVEKTFFSEEVLAAIETDEPRKSPYADPADPEAYVSHADKSPYVPGEEVEEEEPYRSPYTTPRPAPEEGEPEEFKSPYTTPGAEDS